MMIVKHVIDGGLPRGWSVHNLVWLAQAHRHHAGHPQDAPRTARAAWHARWAAFLEDLVETHRVNRH